jgi:hypothetical protein
MNCANSLRYGTANEPIYLLNIKIEYDENGMAWPLVVKLKKLQLILVSFFFEDATNPFTLRMSLAL